VRHDGTLVSENRAERDGLLERASIHDAVLAAIPASLGVAAVVGFVLSLSVGTTLAAGAVPATGTVGYALFYNPPEE
jgi:hypothetical protein